jgi:thiol-disulfide isomerase/thioredoxin
MKKTLLIVATVVALLAVVILADRRASGSPDPATNMVDLQGQPIDLAPYKGKVVLINFWATYCKPCLTEIPWMNEFQDKYSGQGFQILGVNMDEEGAEFVQKWLAEPQVAIGGEKVQLKFNFPVFLGNSAVADAYGGLIGLPTTLLFNREGKVVKRYIGISSKEKLEKAIEELL